MPYGCEELTILPFFASMSVFLKVPNVYFLLTPKISKSSSEVLATEELWPLMLALCGFTDLLQLIAMRFYPETPAYLLLVKRDQQRCLKGNAH